MWTKKQAEYRVGGNIGLATACRGLGSPYRERGVNYYYRLMCVIAFRSGAQYMITIKPTGATKYKTLSARKIRDADPPAPTPAPVPVPAPAPAPAPVPAPSPTPVPVPPPPSYGGSSKLAGCYFEGQRLAGRVKVVDYLADFRVKVVNYLPDLRVQRKDYLATACGEWQFVDYLPDFTIQIVDYLPDFSIQFVNYMPGLP